MPRLLSGPHLPTWIPATAFSSVMLPLSCAPVPSPRLPWPWGLSVVWSAHTSRGEAIGRRGERWCRGVFRRVRCSHPESQAGTSWQRRRLGRQRELWLQARVLELGCGEQIGSSFSTDMLWSEGSGLIASPSFACWHDCFRTCSHSSVPQFPPF